MLNAARRLARRGDVDAMAAKIAGAPREGHAQHAQFVDEVRALMQALSSAGEFRAGAAVRAALARLREHVAFMTHDRAMDADVRRVCDLVATGELLR
jgi:histidine ammonia-lyase